MKRIYLVLAVFSLLVLIGCERDEGSSPTNPSNPQQPIFNWSAQPSYTDIDFTDVYFTGSNTGWVVGEEAVILSTVSGGTDWPLVPVGSTEDNFQAIFFTDNQKGWVVGSLPDDEEGGEVLITVNGGAYPEVQEAVDYPLNTVFFIDENTGWVGGNNGLVLQTSDGGAMWAPVNIENDDAIFDLHFLDEHNGWAATDSGGIYHTLDGVIWQKEDIKATSAIRAIHFVDTLHGWACGAQNTILQRTQVANNAPTWTRTTIDLEFASIVWTDIFFTDAQTGWVVGEGGSVYKSTDGGNTWNPETTSIRSDLNAIFMVSSTKGWIVGEEGAILTYTP